MISTRHPFGGGRDDLLPMREAASGMMGETRAVRPGLFGGAWPGDAPSEVLALHPHLPHRCTHREARQTGPM